MAQALSFVRDTRMAGANPSPWRRAWQSLNLRRRRLIRDDNRRIREKAERWLAVSPPDRLSDAEIAEQSNYEWDRYEADIVGRRSLYESRPVEETFPGQTMPLLRDLLAGDPKIRTVVEIGCYYGWVLDLLAREHPQVEFLGIDFMKLLPEINAEFTAPNLRFRAGYALDLLERGEAAGDLYPTCSTITRFKNAELRRYLAAVRNPGAYFVINEPLFHLPGDVFVHPDSLPSDQSLAVVHGASSADMPPCFIHNYEAIFRECGFHVLHYRIYVPKFTVHPNYRIEMVAQRR